MIEQRNQTPVRGGPLAALVLVAAALGGACAPDEPRAAGSDAGGGGDRASEDADEELRSSPRSGAPAVTELRAALDGGRLARALELLAAMEGAEKQHDAEIELLRARAAALGGRGVEASRRIELARAATPDDPRVYATAAEIHASAGRFDTAWAEVRRGEELCGANRSELVRARGVIWISRQGGAEEGVELLERAVRSDPELPFTARALGQGHLLLAKHALANGGPGRALSAVRRSLSYDPDDLDARRLLADTLAATGDLEGSVEVLEALVASGAPLESELALQLKRAAVMQLVLRDQPAAVERFARARALGLDDHELGTGARLLAEEASRHVDRGVEAFRAGDDEAAAASFRAALELEPDDVEARNHLGVALYRAGDVEGAVDAWRAVLDTAYAEDFELPEPVHLNVARALVVAGDVEGARLELTTYLDRVPAGRWVDETRDVRDGLPASAAPDASTGGDATDER